MNMIGLEDVAVNAVAVQLTHKNRMQLINMLTYGNPEETVNLVVRVWSASGDKPTAEVDIDGGIGIVTYATDLAIKLKKEGNES